MKKKAGYGHELQVKENDRQREFEKFLDTVFERLWERVIGLEMCDYCLLYGLDIVSDLAKVQVGLDSSKCHPPFPFAWFTVSAIFHEADFIKIHSRK